MKIAVTDQHIAEGEPCSPQQCPVALACIDAGFIRPAITALWITCSTSSGEAIAEYTPYETWDFIERFDGGKPVKPFTFELTIRDS